MRKILKFDFQINILVFGIKVHILDMIQLKKKINDNTIKNK